MHVLLTTIEAKSQHNRCMTAYGASNVVLLLFALFLSRMTLLCCEQDHMRFLWFVEGHEWFLRLAYLLCVFHAVLPCGTLLHQCEGLFGL